MQIPDVLKNKWIQVGTTAVVAFAGGYILGKKNGAITIVPPEPKKPAQLSLFDQSNTEERYLEDQIKEDPELERLLDEEERLAKERGKAIVEDILKKKEYIQPKDEPQEPIRVNVFRQPEEDGDWDYDAEVMARRPDEPYILHADEYLNDEMEYHQETVEYYEGDDIMCDMHGTIIYNHAGLMGDLKFGHGSKDPSVVYIRNESEQREWEVLRHTGHYQIEVLGVEAEEEIEHEIRHAGPMKFRRE